MQGLDGGLGFPVATRRRTKLSILFPLVSVSNRFPPNGNDSSPLSLRTSSFFIASLSKPKACHTTHAVSSLLIFIFQETKVSGMNLNSEQNAEIRVIKDEKKKKVELN